MDKLVKREHEDDVSYVSDSENQLLLMPVNKTLSKYTPKINFIQIESSDEEAVMRAPKVSRRPM